MLLDTWTRVLCGYYDMNTCERKRRTWDDDARIYFLQTAGYSTASFEVPTLATLFLALTPSLF